MFRLMVSGTIRFCFPTNLLTDTFHSHPIDDVLKARLKTVGVCEYKFRLEASAGSESGTEWRIIDVGGSRSQVWYRDA
jgi:hypothetical protein